LDGYANGIDAVRYEFQLKVSFWGNECLLYQFLKLTQR
jgi:hypothetical protein